MAYEEKFLVYCQGPQCSGNGNTMCITARGHNVKHIRDHGIEEHCETCGETTKWLAERKRL